MGTFSAMADERAAFLAHLEDVLRADGRIIAAWLGGSIGAGEADDLSDIDIHLAVADEHTLELNTHRRAFVSQSPLQCSLSGRSQRPGGTEFGITTTTNNTNIVLTTFRWSVWHDRPQVVSDTGLAGV